VGRGRAERLDPSTSAPFPLPFQLFNRPFDFSNRNRAGFNFRSSVFERDELKKFTPESALECIRNDHPDFYVAILQSEGFCFNGEWIQVDENGNIVNEDDE
jgi:hypothetical protein